MARRPRAAVVVLALACTLWCTSCVLTEGDQYLVQTAPPNGVHVTLSPDATGALVGVSEMVRTGVRLDPLLAARGYAVRCDRLTNTRASGDRCALAVLRATPIRGSLAARAPMRAAWLRATHPWEEADFASDAMAPVRAHRRACAHVTLRLGPVVPDANWTWRAAGARGCS